MYGNWVSAIPSRFVDELPQDHITVQSDTGLYGAGRSVHWDSSGVAAAQRRRDLPGTGRRVTSEDGTVFSCGDRIKHDKFGEGAIIHIDGHKLDIVFDHGGRKRVMDSFVEKI